MERAVIFRLVSTLDARSASLLLLVKTGGVAGPHTETIIKEISINFFFLNLGFL